MIRLYIQNENGIERTADIGIGRPLSLTGPNHQALDMVYLNTAKDGRLVPLTASLAIAETED